MSIQTKFALTVVAMLCTICVMAVGVWAVMSDFEVQVINSPELMISNVDGTLFCTRRGGGGEQYENVVLYSQANDLVSQEVIDTVFSVAEFENGTSHLEYILFFTRDQTSDSDTWVNLEDTTISDGTYLIASYKFAQTKEEPNDWAVADSITGTIVSSMDKPYLWIRLALTVKQAAIDGCVKQRGLSWGFKLNFYNDMRPRTV